jgi:hypothetical protein
VPARQPEQPLDPATEFEPGAQLEQLDDPDPAEYNPALHKTHAEALDPE